MKIGIDCHVLQEGWQGSRRYIEGIYQTILALPNQHEWVFLLNDATKIPNGWHNNVDWRGFNTHNRIARLGWVTPARIRELKIDCYHTQYISPFIKSCREVVTVHDILFETHPQFFPVTTPYILAPLIRKSANRSDLIVTVSEYSKQMISDRWKIPEERICLTHNAVDPNIFNPGNSKESKEVVRNNYLIEDYILSVGRIEPRKNLPSLVRSYAHLKARGKSLPKLVFVGGKSFGYKDLTDLIHKLMIEDDVIFLHSVSDLMLPHLYRAALVMLYPSFAEGFGIPPLEAMACGCPIISSGNTALREVVGDAGWIIDPNEWITIADALLEAIQSPTQRKLFAAKGLDQATKFSWMKSATTLLEAYTTIV